MTVADIEKLFEEWAPRWTAWERDNAGLQIGRRTKTVRSVLVALDVTPGIVQEAIERKADLIVTHHPLLFRPASTISDSDPVGAAILSLAEKKIAVYSAHTNLDAAPDGVSITLANELGLTDIRILMPLQNMMAKIVFFVPEAHADKVAAAMHEKGAGVIGEYEACSFRTKGIGTFRGSERSRPAVGSSGQYEKVDELRIEMLVPRARIHEVVGAMKSFHPYEEVAYDVYPLENGSPNFGMGAIGNLPKPTTVKKLLARVKRILGIQVLRHTGVLDQQVRRVAVCGGSGSELLDEAIRLGADLFVTADVRYHAFHAADQRIVLVDAGHFETEHVILKTIADRLRSWATSADEVLEVTVAKQSTNPIHFF